MEFPVAKPFVFLHEHKDAHATFDAGFRAGWLRSDNAYVEDVDDLYKYVVSDFKGSRALVCRQMKELAASFDDDYPVKAEDIEDPTVLPKYYAAGLLYGGGDDPREDFYGQPDCERLAHEIAVMQLRDPSMDDTDLEFDMDSIPPFERMTVIVHLLQEPAFVPRMAMFRAADLRDVRLPEVFASTMASGRLAVTWEGLFGDDGDVTDVGLVLAAVARKNGIEATPTQLASLLPEDLTDELADSLMMVPPWRDALAAYRWHPVFTARVLPRWLDAGMTPDLTGIEALFVDPDAVPSTARRAFAMSVDAAAGVLPDLLLNGAPAKAVYDATKRDPRARRVVRRFLLVRDRALKAVDLPVELAAKVLRFQGHRWAGAP